MTILQFKSRDALLRRINPKAPSGPPAIAHRNVMKELKLLDFIEQSRCCHLLSAGDKTNVSASKVTLIKYNDKLKSLLNVESVIINLSWHEEQLGSQNLSTQSSPSTSIKNNNNNNNKSTIKIKKKCNDKVKLIKSERLKCKRIVQRKLKNKSVNGNLKKNQLNK